MPIMIINPITMERTREAMSPSNSKEEEEACNERDDAVSLIFEGGDVADSVGSMVDNEVEEAVGAEEGDCVAIVDGIEVGASVDGSVGAAVGTVIGSSITAMSPASTFTVTALWLSSIEGEIEPDARQTFTELMVKSFGEMVTFARLLVSITSAVDGIFVTPLLLIRVTTQESEYLFSRKSISP